MHTLKFTPTHEWLKEEENQVAVGITDHAQQLLGDLVYIELPEIGLEVQAGGELGVVESVKAASDFYAPVSGVVTAINQAVIDNPELVNKDPFTAGWLVKLTPKDSNELNNLLSSDQYQNLIAEES